ncbi:bifunctional adenosylcobinamide kinase/adenosylcobinamide-phosphate guanylyltransferase [Marinospirillum perlucidum]|uniref:bifunctional adenosylcobinamide kinase/adenosylcobinamide-phosphate guanylyltransferase n=1 Tax=Marinospirillum perlucidum TaxID=1982602 RepID=UPI000DF20809|nr:bifunctional adenosylcobinamide kinase/adenosylcobinamide-phosphate guanylyltransferase [Marinospirillum perlucidum]
MRHLVLGGVRSGKSRLAEKLAKNYDLPVTYLATARAGDTEMQARISEHQRWRPKHWSTQEVSDSRLPEELARLLDQPGVVLLDCLTLWLTQLLCDQPLNAQGLARVDACLDELVEVVQQKPKAHLILVGNETGLGIMPLDELSRAFGDRAGLLHQRLAEVCESVILTAAGLPLILKGSSPWLD